MFSVVIPAYNSRSTIRRAVASVLSQSYGDFELMVVDDGSTDDTLGALVGLDDPRLRWFRQDNLGEGGARNAGVGLAQHEWIAFLDADDFWFEDHLAELHAVRLAADGAALIGTGYFVRQCNRVDAFRPEASGRIGMIDYFEAIGRGEDVLCASTAAVRRGPFECVGGFAAHPAGCDTDLWVRMALRWPVAASTRKTAVYDRATGGSGDRHGTRWLGKPLTSLSELAPAVASLLRETEAGLAVPAADAYVRRQMQWCLHGSARIGDIATLRSLERLFQSPPHRSERIILATAALPRALARLCHKLIYAALALGRRLRRSRRFLRIRRAPDGRPIRLVRRQ